MVDGKRTDDELLRMIAPPAEEALQTLLAEGYIEVIGLTAARASSSARPAPEEGPSTLPPAPHKPVETLRQQAVRFMSEQLGPLGDNLAVKMEKARAGKTCTRCWSWPTATSPTTAAQRRPTPSRRRSWSSRHRRQLGQLGNRQVDVVLLVLADLDAHRQIQQRGGEPHVGHSGAGRHG